MRYALRADQMRAVEARAVAEGIGSLDELMRRAGAAVAAHVLAHAPDGRVLVACGSGNNAGDGWVAARHLAEAGRDCHVLTAVDPERLAGEAARAFADAGSAGVRWQLLDEHSGALVSEAAVIVDAVFGFGFHGEPIAPFARLLELIAASTAFVVSIDVPSGVHADTGSAVLSVRADITVTFTALKPGLLVYPGAGRAGRVIVADIGIPAAWNAVPDALEVPSADDFAAVFPLPKPDDHKGSRGRVALVVGSTTYPGAAVLAARGALTLGAGFTVAVVPEPIADILRIAAPGLLVRPIPAGPDGAITDSDAVMTAVADADAAVVGPGLTPTDGVRDLVSRLVHDFDGPLVLDADALNVLDGPAALRGRARPVVIAPHPGEAARLLGSTLEAVQADRLAAARVLCGPGVVCLLKGARTTVSGIDRRAVIAAGNAALAKAGSGDVLAGMIGTLMAQGLAAYDAAVLGAWLHGRAADHGAVSLTKTCFTSADITAFLPDAVREVTGE